jgi:hypothetical protein
MAFKSAQFAGENGWEKALKLKIRSGGASC